MAQPWGLVIILLMKKCQRPDSKEHPDLNRRITSFEYNRVVEEALKLGLNQGFMQEKSSARQEYTPPFNLEGLNP